MRYAFLFLLILAGCGSNYANKTIDTENEKTANKLIVPPCYDSKTQTSKG